MNSTLQIRIDKKTKKDAQKIFKEMGLDMSTGVKLYLQNVVNTETIPFKILTKNGYTKEQEAKMIKETKESLKNKKSYPSAKEMLSDILK